MKKLRLFAALLACALVFTACAGPAEGGSATAGPAATAAASKLGGYVESAMTMPADYQSVTNPSVLPDGSVMVAAKKGEQWNLLTWANTTTAPSVIPITLPEQSDIQSLSVASDGGILVLTSVMNRLVMPSAATATNTMTGTASSAAPGLSVGGATATNNAGSGAAGRQQQAGGGGTVMFSMDNMKTSAYWLKADGTVDKQFTVQGMTQEILALPGHKAAVRSMQSGGVDILDDAGGIEQTFSPSQSGGNNGGGGNIATNGTSLFLLGGGKLTTFDLATGKESRSADVQGANNAVLIAAPDGTVYGISSSAAVKLGPTDTAYTSIMDTPSYLIGDPTNSIVGACALPEGTLVVMINEGEGSFGGGGFAMRIGGGGSSAETSQLLAYTFLPTLDLSNRTDFTITTLRQTQKLRKAVSEFQRAHPELNVKVAAAMGSTGDRSATADDYIRSINTDILAGKGGDVIILDGLPVKNYIAKGVLTDLSSALSGIDFLDGILQGSKSQDGKLYAMPAQFTFTTLWGKKDIVGQITSLDALADLRTAEGNSVMYARTPTQWLSALYYASESGFRDKNGRVNFDNPEFIAFLEDLYLLYSTQAETAQTAQGGPGQGGQGGAVTMAVPAGGGRNNMQEMQALLNGSIELYPTTIGSTMTLPTSYMVAGGSQSAFIPTPSVAGSGNSYTPSLIAGINAKAKNMAMATEFLKMLYSPVVQELEQNDGLPTVAPSLDKIIADAVERSQNSNAMMFMRMGDSSITVEQPKEEDWNNLRAMCEALNVPTVADSTLMGFIVEETAAFFQGQKTAADTAKSLQQRANSYLNE